MKIIFTKLFKKAQVGPAYENLMEQEVAREEAARRRINHPFLKSLGPESDFWK